MNGQPRKATIGEAAPSSHVTRSRASARAPRARRVLPIPALRSRSTTRPRPAGEVADDRVQRPSSRRGRPGVVARAARAPAARTSREARRAPPGPSPRAPRRFEVEAAREPAGGDVARRAIGARLGRRLEPGGDVRRIAERDGLRIRGPTSPTAALPVLIPTRTAKSDMPHARLDVSAYSLDDLEDAQRSAGRSLGVVLVGRGTPKYAQIPSPW